LKARLLRRAQNFYIRPVYPTLILQKGRERPVQLGHPWIFSGAVHREPEATEGDVVAVCDHNRKILAHGYYSPGSQIRCRLFDFSSEPSLPFADAYWRERIHSAARLRRRWFDPRHTNAWRLLHAEGDRMPGVIADVYDQTVVVQLLIRGSERLLPVLETALQEAGFAHLYLKQKSNTRHLEGLQQESGWRTPPPPRLPIPICENGCLFEVDPVAGQKTGFFLDQRENRRLVGHYSRDRRVLNAFSYTGGFSIYALKGGAQSVESVDSSQPAIDQAHRNAQLNGCDPSHRGITADCFEFLKQSRNGQYDLIVLDPPAFAKKAGAVTNALRGYKEINLEAMKKIAPGGLLFSFSCSQAIDPVLFRKMLFGAAVDSRRQVRLLQYLGQPADHPVDIGHPEGEYLKGWLMAVD